MLRTHYRQPLDWTFNSLDESHKTLWDWYGALDRVDAANEVPRPVLVALCDDLNTPRAITELHKLHKEADPAILKAALNFLGFSGVRSNVGRVHVLKAEGIPVDIKMGTPLLVENERVDELIAARNEARAAKDFVEADRIRDELEEMKIVVEDKPDGKTEWKFAR
jgi:cysteinyl-tRNA synthetase